VVRRWRVVNIIVNMFEVASLTFVKTMRKKPVGKRNDAIMDMRVGLEARRLGEPLRVMRLKSAPKEIKIPPRKDLIIRSGQLRCALMIPDSVTIRQTSRGVWPLRLSIFRYREGLFKREYVKIRDDENG
jgi:hypothetical protein